MERGQIGEMMAESEALGMQTWGVTSGRVVQGQVKGWLAWVPEYVRKAKAADAGSWV